MTSASEYSAARDLLTQGLREGVFPAAQLHLTGPGVDVECAVGTTAVAPHTPAEPVTSGTRFDIASLTKALCTSVLAMQAVAEGRLDLDAPLCGAFPAIAESEAMSARLLLRHRAGLVAHRHFYREFFAQRRDARGVVPAVAPGDTAARDAFIARLAEEPLAARPGSETIYSDPGFMLLGWLIEDAFGERLDRLFTERIAERIGLTRTSFGPVSGPVAATESDENGVMLFGRVHDENARAVGGVCGHAGLFSTAGEVSRLVRSLAYEEKLAPRSIVDSFWAPVGNERFTLGWDTPTGEVSSAGTYTTRGASVGHLGYAGCSVWHDRSREVTVVLLTNRVHPTRENNAIRAFRPRLHDALNEAYFS